MTLIGEQEKNDIISANSYFGTLLLGILPIIGDILLIKWSKSSEVRQNKQNLCKAFLKLKIVLIYPILIIFIAAIFICIAM